MQAGRYPKVTAFVEGSMERMFLNENFHYVNVVSLRNGDSWSLDAMCEQVVSGYRVSSYDPDFVVVWFDKENSNHSSEMISNKVRESLEKEGLSSKKIAICIPDKMSENIILADETMIA